MDTQPTIWTSLQPILAQAARDFLRTVGTALAAHGYITNGGAGVEAFIGAGMTIAGLFWGWWTTSGYIQVGALLKKLTATKTPAEAVQTAQAMAPSSPVAVAKQIAPKILTPILLAAIVLTSLLAFGGQASAQVNLLPKSRPPAAPAITGDPGKDALAAFERLFGIGNVPTTPDEIQNTACDFTLFQKITFANALPLLTKCVQAGVGGEIAPLVPDTQRALDSATAAKDGTAIACLTPALALLTAAAGTPAVKDSSGTITTQAIPPGIVLIGQKLREFVNAGGPSNCRTAVQGTLNGILAAAGPL